MASRAVVVTQATRDSICRRRRRRATHSFAHRSDVHSFIRSFVHSLMVQHIYKHKHTHGNRAPPRLYWPPSSRCFNVMCVSVYTCVLMKTTPQQQRCEERKRYYIILYRRVYTHCASLAGELLCANATNNSTTNTTTNNPRPGSYLLRTAHTLSAPRAPMQTHAHKHPFNHPLRVRVPFAAVAVHVLPARGVKHDARAPL